MPAPGNRLKAALMRGEVQYGLWLAMASPVAAEIAGRAGFDWCLIDAEHGAGDLSAMQAQLMALAGTPASPCVRVPAGEDWIIKRVLDLGAQTVVVPLVHDAEGAARAAAAMRYPPEGVRGMGAGVARASGYGAEADYGVTANAEMLLFVQAESAAAVDNIDAIAATPGVDGVFVGPADLSADMGYPGQMRHPDVLRAVGHLFARIRAAGKIAGTISFDPAELDEFREQGATFLGRGADATTLTAALRALAAVRE